MTIRSADLAVKFQTTTELMALAASRFAKTVPGWTARESSPYQERHFPMRSDRLTIFDAVVAPKLANFQPTLEGYRQCSEALRMASVKSHRRLIERMAFPALA